MDEDQQAQAHRFFAVDCFNSTWGLIDKAGRSPADDEQMVLRAMASVWHWTQRPDCTETNRCIGYWQVARVLALIGDGPGALSWGQKSEALAGEHPFNKGYALEAQARAYGLLGDAANKQRCLSAAQALATQVEDEHDRGLLTTDLAALEQADA